MSRTLEETAVSTATERMSRYRWVIVGLLFAAMVINYVDRQTLGLLKADLSNEFGWSEQDYARAIMWFQAAYAASYLVWGRVIDRVGARWGLGVAFAIWQVAHIMHAGMRGLSGFIFARFILGLGEGGGFPGSIKAVTEWFPKKERAFATGLFNAGTNVGAIVTPLVVPMIVLAWGWEAAFVVTGVAGLIWLPIWFLMYRRPQDHKRVNAAELAHITQDPEEAIEKIDWRLILKQRETWAFALGKFLTDPIWWMFLFWLPDFLGKAYGLDLKSFGPPLVVIYLVSDFGSVSGGWLSGRFMKRGWSINRSRKTTMLICAMAALPVAFAGQLSSLWLAVAIIGLATAAHQGFSANLYTLPSDVFPRGAVATVVGIGGALGGVGGMFMSIYAGHILASVGNYTPIFIVCSMAYLIALSVIHLLMPRMDRVLTDRSVIPVS
ncbi:MFS transporter [Pengzhenrongella frigida]|uniref:MFS transporter n=1 Tax=Pengzhenrongella frigida TaxID=1259133 RepID=A0A4Q5N304_9MICO|nr:MFS transporter [Cellulomonas sp. HLT2-17]RYV52540.1 MFS transporter [Cellulomonas sp. HLT2-17]